MPEYLVALSSERLLRITAADETEAQEKAETKANKDGNSWSAMNAWLTKTGEN
jgi:hypothetical protein